MNAYCLIRPQPFYRRSAFLEGLQTAGHQVDLGAPTRCGPETLLLIWNRYGDNSDIASRVERAGGVVLVAENGYIGTHGANPKWDSYDGVEPGHYYALARGWHNGGGSWPAGGQERWKALGVELKPWRERGDYILVCPNRSFGVPGRMMPVTWALDVVARIRRITQRAVRIRNHPGSQAPKTPLAEELKDAWACVVWSSSCGVHALVEGVPVYCEAPAWICKSAALPPIGKADPLLRLGAMDHQRYDAMVRLAWAQWTVTEIQSGEPFRHLLSDTRQAQGTAHV